MFKDCLLITTSDNRNLFTQKRYLNQLVEFSKVFGAEIAIAKADNPEILSLEALAPALCDSGYNSTAPFEILEYKLPKIAIKQRFIKIASQIKQHIREALLRGETVELQNIMQQFHKFKLTTACFCNHFSKVRQELVAEGHVIEKIGGGKYKIKNEHE
ncbi:MAG: hypothetical protein M0R80_02295 [Proteobacteria bacterium]|jgi:hypothetical protein|nr:hypothetical protein [Pseudomonadota bacterium]